MTAGLIQKRIKVLPSHAALARFLAECDEEPAGYIARPDNIPEPYSYGPTKVVWRHNDGRAVAIYETRHRRYEVNEVFAPLLSEHDAEAEFLARRKAKKEANHA